MGPTTQCPEERITVQKVRSKSTERASVQGNSVGYVAAEEEPESFEDKFKVKESQATLKRTKSLANERAFNIEAKQGYSPNVEPCETVDDFKAKTESVIIGKTKQNTFEQARKEVKTLGLTTNIESVINMDNAVEKKEAVIPTKVRSQSTEKASYVGKDFGYVNEEESPEYFDDKFHVKKNNATVKKEVNKLTELAHQRGIDLGYGPQEETAETFENLQTKHENANFRESEKIVSGFAILEPKHLAQSTEQETSHDISEIQAKEETLLPKKCRSQSIERANKSSQIVGFVHNEEEPELFEDKFKVKTSQASTKTEHFNTRQKALNAATPSSFIPEVENTKDLEEDRVRTESASSKNVTSQITERAHRKTSNIGETPQEEMLQELSDTHTEMEKANINKVRSQSNERASYNPQL